MAFASYAPLLRNIAESIVPHVGRLLSNCASLGAATAVLAVSFQLNLEPYEARQRIRVRLALLTASVVTMTALFAYEQLTARSPQVYALYLLPYTSFLGFSVVDFLRQAVRQSKATRRDSIRGGLRVAAAGCVFALVYVVYKLTRIVGLGLGLGDETHAQCSSLVTSTCAFSVTSPAIAVLLICLGLTWPAVLYPINQARRRRWETRSFETLRPLWKDLSAAMPQIVLSCGRGRRRHLRRLRLPTAAARHRDQRRHPRPPAVPVAQGAGERGVELPHRYRAGRRRCGGGCGSSCTGRLEGWPVRGRSRTSVGRRRRPRGSSGRHTVASPGGRRLRPRRACRRQRPTTNDWNLKT